ncbi:MAG: DUF86 domain-containing protein [Candidatus Lambdaproteobacteria bacterium]|nr:DUF86 domain-containing protein [Candidatus Lambdaproteobacteria bacterium]
MTRHDPTVRLRHIRDFAREALELLEGKTKAELQRNRVLQLAVTRLVEVIGEAAAQVTPEERARFPQLPWRKMIGMRNRLIHGYDVVDLDQLWDTVNDDLPALVDALVRLLPKHPLDPT